MIDMHSHILFGVDDGPATFEESLSMLEQAAAEGITGIISTSHAKQPQYHVEPTTVNEQLDLLKMELKMRNISLSLYEGHEIRLHESLLTGILQNKLLRLAGSKYVLLELPSQNVPRYTIDIINELLANGIIPVIAHPERNKGIAEKPERLARLIRQGAIAQVTAGSISGHFGKGVQRIALQLIDANLVHAIGSDVHNLNNRPFLFDKGLTYLEKKGRADYVDLFLENNENIIVNKDVILLEPETPKKKSWWVLGV